MPWAVFDGPVEPFEALQPLLTGAPHFARAAVRQAQSHDVIINIFFLKKTSHEIDKIR